MGSEWSELTIDQLKAPGKGSIAMGPFGSRIKAENFQKEGVPVIKGGNLHGAIVTDDKFDFLTEEKAEELKSSQAVKRDLVITHRGTIGQVCIIPDDAKFEKYIVSQSQLKVTLNEDVVDPYFVNYFFQSHIGQHRLLANASQVGVPAIAKASTSVKEILVPVPPLPEQKAIAHALGSLDDKIELNRRMNATLEGMAQALFKSWFVDFDPVIDNALAAGNPIPEPLAQRAETRRQAIANGTANRETAQAFPASFRFTEELGWIPEGWEECNLESLATPKKGKNITKKTIIEGKVPVVAGGLQPAYFHNTPNVLGPVITVSASGANAGFVNLYHEDIWASDCSYMSSKETDFVYSTFLFLRSRQDRITHMQQGAAQPHVYPKDLLRLKYANPPKELWYILESIVEASFNKIAENKLESQTLAKLRDVLLPKLISGELRIPQAAKMVEDAIA